MDIDLFLMTHLYNLYIFFNTSMPIWLPRRLVFIFNWMSSRESIKS